MKPIRLRHTALVLCLCLLLTAPCLGGCAKQSSAPPLSDIYDTVVELIERSYAVNDVVLGYGLPVHGITSSYAERMHMYADSDYAEYEYVTDYAPYTAVADIKQALEQVYSTDYLHSLYVTLFDGYVGATGVVRAQLREDGSSLFQSLGTQPLLQGQRIYDYATMRIVSPSSADYVTVELESHLEHEDSTLTVRLGLVREADGWRLDTPTY